MTGHQQANVSKHLLIMAREGFLDRRKEGLNVYYKLKNRAVPGICLLVTACVEWVDVRVENRTSGSSGSGRLAT